MAERAVLDANGNGFETVVLRPRLVWGRGDTTIVPALNKDAVAKGRLLLDRRRQAPHLDNTHVDNVVEGLVLAATKGEPGNAYFVTDGDPVVFREFITRLLATEGVEMPDRSVPNGGGEASGRDF